jgi:chromosome partitioning protein
MAKIVSFINFKGGVGKTTLCVETAASLAGRFNARVLLVDLDPQTNATLSLMTEKEWDSHASTKGTLLDFFSVCYNGKPFDLTKIRYEYKKHPLGTKLHLIPSHLELFGMDLQLATKFGHGNIEAKIFLRSALKSLSSQYDFILVDCPPNIYLATQNGLFASDHYIVVALAEYLSTLGLAHIQKSITGIFEQSNQLLQNIAGHSMNAPPLMGIIFNRVRYLTGGTSNEEEIMAQIRRRYGSWYSTIGFLNRH